MWQKALFAAQDGTYIDLDINPGSGSQSFRGYDEWRNRIKVSVRAEAREGRANTELISMLVDILGISSDCIQITSGQTSGQKRVFIKGMSVGAVIEKLGAHLGPE
jgi:uncharacterized protein (TIGR00251 family)